MHFPRHLYGALGLAGLLALSGCGKRTAVPPPKPVRAVSAAQAILKDIPLYLDEIGNCTAYEAVVVQPQVSGALTAVHFQDGAEIRKGDLLFTIDPRYCQASLAKAQATLESDRAKAAYAQVQVKRNAELSKTKVISAQDYDSLVSTAQAAQATVQADQAAVDEARLNLEYCEIRSPIDGRAGKRKVDIGNIVNANATALLSIQRQDPVYVDFTIPERALSDVRAYREKGTLQVEIRFADDPNKRRLGSFDFLDNGVQQSSGTVRVRAMIDNKDRLFWPGQFVNVRLLLDVIPQSVLVPSDAVQIGQSGPFVFVVKADSTVELRKIQVGQRQEENTAVTKGLAVGEPVVVTGQISLAPGAKVKVVPDGGGK
ncbi:MAG: efflux RND transporter periplasmic adaptor subunit [Chthoniobacteraceae bacterium]|nr:efflux RND transporter periplasmic adaptor subunit [Chthoniobacteraceae bacterium]